MLVGDINGDIFFYFISHVNKKARYLKREKIRDISINLENKRLALSHLKTPEKVFL